MSLEVNEPKIIQRRDGSVGIDGRTTPRAPNLKHLRFSKRLPVKCNDCPYRPKEEGGIIGGCSKYVKDSLCTIRADIRKQIEKFSTTNPDQILPLLQEEFEANYEFLKFWHTMEVQTGMINPEVSKRMNSITNLGKLIAELKREKTTIELEQHNTMSDDMRQDVAKTVRMIFEKKVD